MVFVDEEELLLYSEVVGTPPFIAYSVKGRYLVSAYTSTWNPVAAAGIVSEKTR